MKTKLPKIIEAYIEAKNAHDASATLACFSEHAVVHDEAKDLHGKPRIRKWIEETIRKYKDHLRPIRSIEENGVLVLTAEVSGTFDGSPIQLDFHFTVERDKIAALSIH
jgi:ketosteroid isomerase-like protein